MSIADKTLVIVTGPTASGKTALAIGLARALQCEIISADSRQVYRRIPIVTAAPDAEQLAAAPHHLVGFLEPEESYSAAAFEADVSRLLPRLWEHSDYVVMCGGSMMYIDAFVNGLDNLPDIPPTLRDSVWRLFDEGGLPALHDKLRELDPGYLATADPVNHKRLIHAIEVSIQAGVPYSSLLTGNRREHPFSIVKLALAPERAELFARIGRRVDRMLAEGLEDEARALYPLRGLNSLNTVGLKEMFLYFDGCMSLQQAADKIARNTRVYAKKQLTWLKRDPSVIYIPADADPLTYSLSIINEE